MENIGGISSLINLIYKDVGGITSHFYWFYKCGVLHYACNSLLKNLLIMIEKMDIFSLDELGYKLDDVDKQEFFENSISIFDVSVTTGYELEVLTSHIKKLEKYKNTMLLELKKELSNELNFVKSEEDRSIAFTKYCMLESELDRMIFNPVVITLWGTVESIIKCYLPYIDAKEDLEVSFSDIKARSFLARTKKYFNNTANMNIDFHGYEKLINIQKIRNFVVHTNGLVEILSKEKQAELKDIIKNNNHIQVQNGYIVISYQAIKEMHKIIDILITNMINTITNKYYPNDI